MPNKMRYIKDVLWILVFFAAIAGLFRFVFGLGATTNLTDDIPWGIWKVLNMIGGVALSTCGFTVGFLVYVLKIKKFKPLLRPAILIAFLGYGSSCFALMFDIGLPQRFWHPFIYWNIHSFLFEVFWCVMLYFTVTFIELIPNILEKYKAEKIVKFLHKIAIGVVIFGISLSSLHHSSLGSLFLTTPQRLHELWYSSLLPLMFIISAMGGGIMFLIFVKIIYARFYNPISVFGLHYSNYFEQACVIDNDKAPKTEKIYGKDMPMLSNMAIIGASLMGFYFLIKTYDLFQSGSINSLMKGTWESWLFGIELLLTAVLPIIIVAIKKTRRSPYWLGFAALSSALGLALNRVNVGIIGYFPDAGTIYIPSLAEWSLSIGIIAGAALAFIYISEHFTIFDDHWKKASIERTKFDASFDSFSRVWQNVLNNGFSRVTLIGVFFIPFAFVLLYPPYETPETHSVVPAAGLDVERNILMINGNSTSEKTRFPHEQHQINLGGKKSCVKCHHISMPNDKSTPCFRCHRNMLRKTKVFDHNYHTVQVAKAENLGGIHPENGSCKFCHPKQSAKTAGNAAKCSECHKQDMRLERQGIEHFIWADSYMDAMHKNCIPCHEKEEKKLTDGRKISECSNCHNNIFSDRENIRLSANK